MLTRMTHLKLTLFGLCLLVALSGVSGALANPVFELREAVPNPSNSPTTLSFEMAVGEHVRMMVYDVAGRLVVTLVDEHCEPGTYPLTWDGRDTSGRMSATGVYMYRLEAGGYGETKKMTLVK